MLLLRPLLQVVAQAPLPVLLLGPLLQAPLQLRARALLLLVPLPASLLGLPVPELVRLPLAVTAVTWESLLPPPLVLHRHRARSVRGLRWGAAGERLPGRRPPFQQVSTQAAECRRAPLQ